MEQPIWRRVSFKVAVAIMSAIVTATSASLNACIWPSTKWSVIALIAFIIFACVVSWGWYESEKRYQKLKDSDAELDRKLKQLELEQKQREKDQRDSGILY